MSIGSKEKSSKNFPVIGIGASAGGLEAIEGFLEHVPVPSGMAIVVVQHRASENKEVLRELLERKTKMRVQEIQEGNRIEANVVYLNPPHTETSLKKGVFYCSYPDSSPLKTDTIDIFLRGLAEDQKEWSICVILSGTGSDGTQGVRAVKAAGGLVIVQDENQAQYPDMPRSAINTGLADYVLPVEKMAESLMEYVRYYPKRKEPKTPRPNEHLEASLLRIFYLIRLATGHDFQYYKRSTVRRRLERRMALHQLTHVADYIRLLEKDESEIHLLFRDLLINVTSFFRDPHAWEVLKKTAVNQLVSNKAPDSTIRVWVPGCSTGDEAYSIAICFAEEMNALKRHHDIQIFATDLDEIMIDTARAGLYPPSIRKDVSPDRLQRFFTEVENGYKIKKAIREMVVFAKQDLIKEPPFSKLDLVCCRNVLIYMEEELQRKLIPLFHYVLNSEGFLFLGPSETVGSFSNRFVPIDSKWRVFQRKGESVKREQTFAPSLLLGDMGDHVEAQGGRHTESAFDITDAAKELLLQEYSKPCVLINQNLDCLYFHGPVDQYLTLPSGKPILNVVRLVRPELTMPLNTAILQSLKEDRTVVRKSLSVKDHDRLSTLHLIVKPVKAAHVPDRLLMVIFDASPKGKANRSTEVSGDPDKSDPRVTTLQQELRATKEYLQSAIEELETSNEELKSANEELQSTNEELETSREELQSTNEELRTVNSEHQNQIDLLTRANNDLSNLLLSMQIGTIFLDMELKIKRFNPEATKLFKLMERDIDRPLSDIVHTLRYDSLLKDIDHVLATLNRVEKRVQTQNGQWMLLRILPYRTNDNIVSGVLLNSVDITKEYQITEAKAYFESIFEAVRQPLVVLDKALRITSANAAFYHTFRMQKLWAEGVLIFDLGNGQWDLTELKTRLQDMVQKHTFFDGYRIEHTFPEIGHKVMLVNARRMLSDGQPGSHILLEFEDITDNEQVKKRRG